MTHRIVHSFAAVCVLVLWLTWASPVAHAELIFYSVVGGVPTGVNYVNFDNLTLGNTGGTSGGIDVSFASDGQAVQGTADDSAQPYLSNGNGTLFGDPNNGPDATTYLSTGPTGSVILTLPGPEMYLGLLWGSVDSYNTLSFYDGSTLVGTITGDEVTAFANGNQGASGTFYVNINSTLDFTKVVASSPSPAFEFDNVAYNPTEVGAAPEPSSIVLLGIGLMGLGFIRRRNIKGKIKGSGLVQIPKSEPTVSELL